MPRWGKPGDRARHDKLVELVDKMPGLMPGLRAATSESERDTPQNAVASRQLDALVHELHCRTPEASALVEGGQ